jgi:hypothetical protein
VYQYSVNVFINKTKQKIFLILNEFFYYLGLPPKFTPEEQPDVDFERKGEF